METETQNNFNQKDSDREPSLRQRKMHEYLQWGEQYKRIVSTQDGSPQQFDRSLEKKLNRIEKIPKEWYEEIHHFAEQMAQRIPESCLESGAFSPFNRVQLHALLAEVFNSYQPDVSNSMKEYEIRLLISLSAESLVIKNNQGTEQAVQRFFFSKKSRQDLYDCMCEVLRETMPVASVDSNLPTAFSNYERFYSQLEQKLESAMAMYWQYIDRFFPERKQQITVVPPIYVKEIERQKIFSNTSESLDSQNYDALSADAFTNGIDTLTHLPLSVHALPVELANFTHEDWEDPENDLLSDELLTILHENIHNARGMNEPDYTGDFLSAINELLTDATAHIIFAQTENFSFIDPPLEHQDKAGYESLVKFARFLIEQKFFLQDELVKFALDQNPQAFLEQLDQRIQSGGTTAAAALFYKLNAQLLILPSKSTEFPKRIAELLSNPQKFLKEHMSQAWEVLGSEWLTPSLVRSLISDELQAKFPGKDRDFYRQLIFSSDNHQGLSDEGVEIFYQQSQEEKIIGSRGYFVEYQSEKELLHTITDLPLTSNLPENFQREMLLSSSFKRNLMNASLSILSEGLKNHYKFSENKKKQMVVQFMENYYRKVVETLFHSLPNIPEAKFQENIKELCFESIPDWFFFEGAKFHSPEEILHAIVTTLTVLCENPHNNNNQWEFVKYWSNAIKFSELSGEEDKL